MARILLVDDNEAHRMQLSTTLQTAGHDVIVAQDGALGFLIAVGTDFDLVLVEARMDDVTGLDMLELMRTVRGKEEVPAFVLTSLATTKLTERARRSNAIAWLTRPLRPNALVEEISRALAVAA